MSIKQEPRDDQRETRRTSLHPLENQYAWIMTRNGEVRTRIIDFSPFGLGVVLDGSSNRVALAQGDQASIQLERDGQAIVVEATLVTIGQTTILKQPHTRLGFKIHNRSESPGREHLPRSRRFALSDAVDLTCYCDDPTRAGQKAFFTIRDLSIRGILLETSARNKFLLPNLKLLMSITVPGSGEFNEPLQVRHVRSLKDRYLLGCEFEGLGAKTIEGLGEFCLNFGKDVSYQIMLEEGFPLKLEASGLQVHASASYQDFMQITRLRLEYEHAKGRQLAVSDPWQMIDEHDDEAQHICVKLGKKVVASARLVFNQGDRKRTSSGPGEGQPPELWTTGIATLSKIALVPEFEGHRTYVFSRLWEEVFRLALQSEMASMLIVHPDVWPEDLLKLGFKPQTGADGAVDKITRLDLKNLFDGKALRFTAWSFMIAPLSEALIRTRKLTITRTFTLKLAIARTVRRLLLWKRRRNQAWRGLESREADKGKKLNSATPVE